MEDRVILHVDLNGFFAGVECRLNPELEKQPMAVCGDPAIRHGIILAKNEKAKKFGVQTAETIWSAKQKCPGLILVVPHHKEYAKYSRLCNEIYLRYTDLVEPFGIDESWLDVTGSRHLFGDGKMIADDIRKTVREELGLTVSVGVSFNKIFAKLGSDYRKPDATTVITREHGKRIVFPLPVSALLFVGRRSAVTLKKLGIETIGNLAKYDRDVLIKNLGKIGGTIHDYANGRDDSPVRSYYALGEGVKSVGNGSTFEYDIVGFDDLKTRVAALCDSVGYRMRKKGFKCQTLQVAIKDPDFKTINRQKKITATNVTRDLANVAMEIICENWREGNPIRLITITASNLVGAEEVCEQVSMFEDLMQKVKKEKLQAVVDRIREKFGEDSIT